MEFGETEIMREKGQVRLLKIGANMVEKFFV